MPTCVVEQDVDRDVLLGRAAAQVEHRLVGAHEVQALVGVHAGERRLRTRVQRDAGVARQVARGSRGRRPCCSKSSSITELHTSSSTKPVQPESVASSLRYSSASSPTTPALRRSGRSLVTTTTSRPSRPRLSATARMRWSLAGDVSGCGQRVELLVVELDPERAALVVDRHRLEQRAVAGAQVLEEAEALAGRPPQLGVVALALELGEHHEREHDLVLGEARDRQTDRRGARRCRRRRRSG